jgi:hypothetical protein
MLPLASAAFQLRARDEYLGGAGRMLVKVASLLPLVDASSEEMGQALP